MPRPLPFDGFLEILRARGLPVGLNEHFQLGALLARWDRTNADEFRDAVAALIARNDEEVRDIKRIFDEIYAPAPAPLVIAPPEPPWWRRGPTVAGAALLAAAVLVGGAWWTAAWPFAPSPPPQQTTVTPPVASPPTPPPAPPGLPPPRPPPPPPEPVTINRRFLYSALGAIFAVTLGAFWRSKAVNERRAWRRTAWASALGTLPGPFQFEVPLRGRPAGLPRSDVEDAATLLSRAFVAEAQARELDARRSVRATLRHGLMPHLLFRPRRLIRAILVLQDIGADMRPWQAKVDAFLRDLRRQGIPLDRLYFDADLRYVSERAHSTPTPLDQVLRRRPDAPILIVGTGAGLAATLAQPDDAWRRELGGRPRRAWLNPVADAALWPDELRALPMTVWPMTRSGLAAASRELSGAEDEPAPAVRVSALAEGAVSADDIERVQRLASLVPSPSAAVLDLLRRKFAPDVSDAVLAHLLVRTGSRGVPVVRLDPEDARRCVEAVRRETPALEAAVRRFLLDLLRDAEPPPGSAARLRWEAAVAFQDVLLADLEGREPTGALEALRGLGRSPIWAEVRGSAQINAPTAAVAGRIASALGTRLRSRAEAEPPAVAEQTPGVGRAPTTWPGVPHVVLSAVAAGAVVLVGVQLDAFPRSPIPNVRGAYALSSNGAAQTPPSELRVESAAGRAGLPQVVDVYRREADDEMVVFARNVSLASTPAVVRLAPADLGSYFQARARLPPGNYALSEPLWVPSGREVNVLIDAAPWANVTVTSADGRARRGTTPYVAPLEPGSYTLRLENGGLTPPTTETIDVSASARSFRFTMPGFDPARTAATLAGGSAGQNP